MSNRHLSPGDLFRLPLQLAHDNKYGQTWEEPVLFAPHDEGWKVDVSADDVFMVLAVTHAGPGSNLTRVWTFSVDAGIRYTFPHLCLRL